MIFVSSSCIKTADLHKSVERLVQLGFKNIELSGGTSYDGHITEKLLELKAKHNLVFLCHNYFPPPPIPFVVNLASLNEEIARMTLEHLHRALVLTEMLGEKKFSFHAGFLMNIPLNEVGQSISKQELFDKELALQAFCDRFNALQQQYPHIRLYIENNVISARNLQNFGGINPLFITDRAGLDELRGKIDFSPLLDVAHLKVSCHSLGLDLKTELDAFMPVSDYIHISDNDGTSDSNQVFTKNGEMFDLLSAYSMKGRTITLEVYSGEPDLVTSYEAAMALK